MVLVLPLVAWALAQAAPESRPAVSADPNPCLPGQTVKFYPPKEAKRVLITGGAFAKQTDVTAQPLITDKLVKTTTYRFELTVPGAQPASGKPAPLIKQSYAVTANVYEGKFPPFATYFDTRDWRIDVPAGWNRYTVPSVDPVNNAVLYFQPAEDSPDRIAVAIVPVTKETDSKTLLRQVLAEAPSQYDVFLDAVQKETTQSGLPAAWMTFKGMDQALPGIPTRSMVLTLVRDGRGYVVSARTRESDYPAKEKFLRCLVRSLAFAKSPPRKPPAPAKKDATKDAKQDDAKKPASSKPAKSPPRR
jgi:hypothetical protein